MAIKKKYKWLFEILSKIYAGIAGGTVVVLMKDYSFTSKWFPWLALLFISSAFAFHYIYSKVGQGQWVRN